MPINLPPAQYPNFQTAATREESQPYRPSTAPDYGESTSQGQSNDLIMFDQMTMPGTIPVFGIDGTDGLLNRSPYVGMPSDFLNFLFNSEGNAGQGSPMGSPVMAAPYSK